MGSFFTGWSGTSHRLFLPGLGLLLCFSTNGSRPFAVFLKLGLQLINEHDHLALIAFIAGRLNHKLLDHVFDLLASIGLFGASIFYRLFSWSSTRRLLELRSGRTCRSWALGLVGLQVDAGTVLRLVLVLLIWCWHGRRGELMLVIFNDAALIPQNSLGIYVRRGALRWLVGRGKLLLEALVAAEAPKICHLNQLLKGIYTTLTHAEFRRPLLIWPRSLICSHKRVAAYLIEMLLALRRLHLLLQCLKGILQDVKGLVA